MTDDIEFARRLAQIVGGVAAQLPENEADQLDALLRDGAVWSVVPTLVQVSEDTVSLAITVAVGGIPLACVSPDVLGLDFTNPEEGSGGC